MSISKNSQNIQLDTKRHSFAHLMAAAVGQMFPEAQFGVGPVIENGCYYDFILPRTLIPEDLPLLEKRIKKMLKQPLVFKVQEVELPEAIALFEKMNQPLKVELLNDLATRGTTSMSEEERADFEMSPLERGAEGGVCSTQSGTEDEICNPTQTVKNKLGILPYNPELKQKAKELRNNSSKMEVRFWCELKNHPELSKIDFHRQKPILNYIVDFYLPQFGIAVELDGDSHDEQMEYDEKRTVELQGLGIKVLRYTNEEVKNNLDGVFANINREVNLIKNTDRPRPSDTPLKRTHPVSSADTPLKRGLLPKITIYRLENEKTGEDLFVDLCKGPHIESIKEFSQIQAPEYQIQNNFIPLTQENITNGEELASSILKNLKANQIEFRHLEHEETPTSKDSAKARGTTLEEGVKSLILVGKASGRHYQFNLPSNLKIDLKKVQKITQEECELEKAEVIKEKFGLEIGGIPPFGKLLNIKTYFDKNILLSKKAAFNCGLKTQSVVMNSQDLLDLNQAQVESFSKDESKKENLKLNLTDIDFNQEILSIIEFKNKYLIHNQPNGKKTLPILSSEILNNGLTFGGSKLKNNKVEIVKEQDNKQFIKFSLESKPEGDFEFLSKEEFNKFLQQNYGFKYQSKIELGFKLDKFSGSYWRGDQERNIQMQRIYALVFDTKEELKAFEEQRKLAQERDHRKLGKELEIFMVSDEVGSGLPLYLPNGAAIRQLLEKYCYQEAKKSGYQYVYTPHIGKEDLFAKSGHLSHYRDGMFAPIDMVNLDGEGADETGKTEKFYLKPMNCPMHHNIYLNTPKSYRDLPYRLYEYGTVYRYEESGTLSGMIRVRGFTQNDAHVYCQRTQLKEVIGEALNRFTKAYNDIGITDYKIRFSLPDFVNEPEKFGEETEEWRDAVSAMRQALDELGVDYYDAVGEAAFYGPKIDIQVKNVNGKEDSLSTIQVDYSIAPKFGITFKNEKGEEEVPAIIHMALMGSVDRFMAFMLEMTGGRLPLWLAPTQVKILTINNEEATMNYVAKIKQVLDDTVLMKPLKYNEIRYEVDDRSESLGKKIREATKAKIPVQLIVGPKDIEAGEVSVRMQSGEEKVRVEELRGFVEGLG